MPNGPSRAEIAENWTGPDYHEDPEPLTCSSCGDEFEPWPDSYCGRPFMETEVCLHCAEDDGVSDPLGGWNEDVLRDR